MMLALISFGFLIAVCAGDSSRTINFYDFGQTVTIECTTKTLQPDNDTFVHYWLVPNYKIKGDEKMWVNETYEMSGTWMESNGWKLNVGYIRHTESGKYTCVWQETGTEQTNEIELKFVTPSQLRIYYDNVTVGLIATAAFIGIIIVIFLVYYFRWKDPEKENKALGLTTNGVEQRPETVYENQAFHRTEPPGPAVVQVVHNRNSGGVTESKM